MDADGEEASRALYSALAAAATAEEQAREQDISQAELQERSEKLDAKIVNFLKVVEGIEETVEAARENVKTKEKFLIELEQEVNALEKKERAAQTRLRLEGKSSVDQWVRTERDLTITDRKMKRAAFKVKSLHGIPRLEKEVAQVTKERDAKKEGVKVIDKEIEKVLKAARSSTDERNAFVVQLATLLIDTAMKEKQVQKVTEEIEQLESQRTQLQDRARAQARVSSSPSSSRLASIPPFPQNIPTLLPRERQASLNSASPISPNTEQHKFGTRPKMPDKSLPIRNGAPCLSPLLMPPPGPKQLRSALRTVRPAVCSAQPASSTYLGGLGTLLHNASLLQSPEREHATPGTSAGDNAAAPRKLPSLQPPERELATPGTSAGDNTAARAPRKLPSLQFPERELASPGTSAGDNTSAGAPRKILKIEPKILCRSVPSHPGERAEPSLSARVTSAPDYQRILRTVAQTPATHLRTAAGAALPFRKPVSAPMPCGEGSLPGPSTVGDHQQRPYRVRFPCADQLERRQSDMPALGQMNILAISQDTESLASQSSAPSTARDSSVLHFLEREEATGPSGALGDGESSTQSSNNASVPKSSPGDTGYDLFGDDNDSGGGGFFFNMDSMSGPPPRLNF